MKNKELILRGNYRYFLKTAANVRKKSDYLHQSLFLLIIIKALFPLDSYNAEYFHSILEETHVPPAFGMMLPLMKTIIMKG